jgi:DNA-binding IclR family transcriptional regulator
MAQAATGTQAVDRAALLLSTVVQAAGPLPFAEIAEECGLPRSTTSRLLTALERTELLERDATGAYVAGPLFWLYASRHDPWEETVRLGRPILEAVSKETGETVNLGVVRGDRVMHVAQVDSRYHLGTRDWTTVDVPPYASALGKVLYAYGALPPPPGPAWTPLTPATVPDLPALQRELAMVLQRGFATTVDELEVGLTGIAAPVRAHGGNVVAALGLSGPTQRLDRELTALGALLVDQANQLSRLLRRSSTHTARKVGAA